MNNQDYSPTEITQSWYPILFSMFTAILIASNIYALKFTHILGLITPCGMLCFPFTFSISNVVTEVYGYAAARRMIFIGMLILCAFYALLYVVINMAPPPNWDTQEAFSHTFEFSHRIFLGTIVAYLVSELINSKTLSILKYITLGRIFIPRSLAATIVGITVDTVIFNFISFYGIYQISSLLSLISQQYILKVSFDIMGCISAFLLANYIKQKEKIDVIDNYTYKWIDNFISKIQNNEQLVGDHEQS